MKKELKRIAPYLRSSELVKSAKFVGGKVPILKVSLVEPYTKLHVDVNYTAINGFF